MWLARVYALAICLVPLAYASSCLDPGSAAPTYADGAFSLPNGNTPVYTVGTTMNISWTTDYDSSTLWLITGCDFATPTKSLTTGSSQKWYQWQVDTTSTNSSEIYLFRVVNALGTTADQRSGGFLSAGFYIAGGPSSTSTTSTSTSTTSSATGTTLAVSPVSTTGTPTSASTSAATPVAETATESSGLSTGAKAGIGVGIACGVIGMIALIAAILLRRRSKKTDTAPMTPAAPAPTTQEYKPPVAYSEVDAGTPYQSYDDHYNKNHNPSYSQGYQQPPQHQASELPSEHRPVYELS